MVWDLFSALILILIMVVASGAAVDIFEKLAHELKVNKLLMATILVGFSTSLPELFVGIASAMRGQSEIALGNILGANIANLSWIVGGAALMAGSIPVVGDYLRKDLWVTMGMGLLPLFLMTDGNLTRLDGCVLILIYLFYVRDMVRGKNALLKHGKLVTQKRVKHHFKTEVEYVLGVVKLVAAFGILIVSSSSLISLAIDMSSSSGVSVFWVGLLIISFGTTLPELVLSLMASEKREMSLVLGNILGSVVVNSSLVLGVIVLISPLKYSDTAQSGSAGLFVVFVMGLFWLFTKSKHKLERWEGMVLVGIYAMFVGLQFLLA
jgi:cation:H+ antiporter